MHLISPSIHDLMYSLFNIRVEQILILVCRRICFFLSKRIFLFLLGNQRIIARFNWSFVLIMFLESWKILWIVSWLTINRDPFDWMFECKLNIWVADVRAFIISFVSSTHTHSLKYYKNRVLNYRIVYTTQISTITPSFDTVRM